MLEYDRIDISEGSDINKCEETSRKYGRYLCDDCYDMSMKVVSIQNLTIINHNRVNRVIFAFISKKDAYNLIKNAIIMGEKGTL